MCAAAHAWVGLGRIVYIVSSVQLACILAELGRAEAAVYTSGEHCPMCAAAHAWVGLGRIVYIVSSVQVSGMLTELDGWTRYGICTAATTPGAPVPPDVSRVRAW